MGPLQWTYESPQEPPRLALLTPPRLLSASPGVTETPPHCFHTWEHLLCIWGPRVGSTPTSDRGEAESWTPRRAAEAGPREAGEAETEPDGDRRWPLEGPPPPGCFSDGRFHQEFFTSQIWGTYIRLCDRGHLPPDSARISGGRGAPRGKGLKREKLGRGLGLQQGRVILGAVPTGGSPSSAESPQAPAQPPPCKGTPSTNCTTDFTTDCSSAG